MSKPGSTCQFSCCDNAGRKVNELFLSDSINDYDKDFLKNGQPWIMEGGGNNE